MKLSDIFWYSYLIGSFIKRPFCSSRSKPNLESLKKVDENGDGQIDFDEFMARLVAAPATVLTAESQTADSALKDDTELSIIFFYFHSKLTP